MMAVCNYTPRPLTVRAVQWVGDNFDEVRGILADPHLAVLTESGQLVLLDEGRVYPMVPLGCYVGVAETGKIVAFSPISFESLYELAH